MRVLSRSSKSNKASVADSARQASLHTSASADNENVSRDNGTSISNTTTTKPPKRTLFARSRRSESTPRALIMTPFRSNRKQITRSKSTPRSSVAQLVTPDHRPTIIPPTDSLVYLTSVAIDAQTPGSAEVSFSRSYSTPEHDSVCRQLFPVDSDSDHDDDMSAPLLSTRHQHHTVDIGALAMVRTATIQSTEVYCVMEQDEANNQKRVWETLFQPAAHHHDQEETPLDRDDSIGASPKSIAKALVKTSLPSSEQESFLEGEDIEMSMSVWDAEKVDVLHDVTAEYPTASGEKSHDMALNYTKQVINEEEEESMDDNNTNSVEEILGSVESVFRQSAQDQRSTEASATRETPAVSNAFRERSMEIKPFRPFGDGLDMGKFLISVESRKSSDEPDEQPPRRRRSIANDVASGDDLSSLPSYTMDIQPRVSVIVESVNSNSSFLQECEEKKEDSSDVAEMEQKPAPTGNRETFKRHADHWEEYAKSLVQQCIKSDTATKVLGFLRCGNDVTVAPGQLNFDYDSLCNAKESQPVKEERSLYDESFTLAFIKLMMTKGITVFNLQAPGSENNSSSDWIGRAVNMIIEPGTSSDKQNMEPKLEWTILPGGERFEVHTTSITLLAIHSISTSLDSEVASECPDKVFFTIMTELGAEHIFEANCPEERDMIVNGIRNVIARLAYHLIAGDPAAALGLYKDDSLASTAEGITNYTLACPHPDHTMNGMAHILLHESSSS